MPKVASNIVRVQRTMTGALSYYKTSAVDNDHRSVIFQEAVSDLHDILLHFSVQTHSYLFTHSCL